MGTVWFRQGTSLELPQTAPASDRPADPGRVTSSRTLYLSPAPTAYLDTALRLTAIALLLRPMGPSRRGSEPSMMSTWGIVALEAAVAAMMLAPARRTGAWRHVLLLTFCGITYAFAPVAGFGWLLLVMGLAQVEERQVWIARLYVVAFLVVLFYDQLPWTELALDFFRGG
jgi:hypothetical protein